MEKTSHIPIWAARGLDFIWHFAQMYLVMEAGMLIYHRLIRPALVPTGFPALTMRYPLFGYWMMVASMVIPMLALMRVYHKSTWRYSLGMTLAMVAPLAAMSTFVLFSLIPIDTLFGIGDPVMYVAMAAYMVFHPQAHHHSSHQPACHAAFDGNQ
jgi:hypothetical protein